MIEEERLIAAPYPGLRPFETTENFVFFGRDGQSDEVLSKLRAAKFVAVVGTSGSGKSSLVRAGLLPALLSGHMTSAGSNWRIAIFRPGNSPIKNLTDALNAPDVFGTTDPDQAPLRLSNIERTLRRSSLGLLEVVSQSRMKKGENLLILADQFEELFRFKHAQGDTRPEDEAAAFVKLLLEARQAGKDDEERLPIYIILTMRSDYLGDCANFWGLPEAINDGQYLIPRMTDDDRREAITGPAIIGGGQITSPLVNRLMNDAGEDPARLPIMQHALMRTWDYWKSLGKPDAPIDLVHYEKIGTMTAALSIHADEAFFELSPPLQKVAEKLFKGLTEKEADRKVRRPATIAEIAASAEVSEEDVKEVVENFRREGRSFLMPPPSVKLESDTLIDISHESLIGGWDRLKAWVEEEAQAAWQYLRLSQSAALFPDQEGYLRGPALQMSLRWRQKNRPTAAWAMRYDPNFEKAIEYLEQSKASLDAEVAEQERKRKEEIEKDLKHAEAMAAQEKRRATLFRRGVIVLVFLLLGMLATTLFAVRQTAVAKGALRQAEEQRNVAQTALGTVSEQKKIVEKTLSELEIEKSKTDGALKTVEVERDNARTQKLVAEEATAKALQATAAAEAANAVAQRERAVAEAAQKETEQVLNSLQAEQAAKKLVEETAQQQLALVQEIDRSAPYYKMIMRGHEKEVHRVAFSPDGKFVLTSDADNGVVWDSHTGKPSAPKSTSVENADTSTVVISPGGKYALQAGSSEWGVAYIWDRTLGKKMAEIKYWTSRTIYKSIFSADEQLLVTANPRHNSISVIDVKTGKVKELGEGFLYWLKNYALSPDGKRVATTRSEAYAQLWDVDTGNAVAQLRHLDEVKSVAFSPDSKFVVTTSKDGTATIWDATSGTLLTKLAGHAGPVNSAMFDPTSNYLITTSEKVAYLWKAKVKGSWSGVTDDSPHTMKGHTDLVTQALFSPDGEWVATTSRDRTAQLWDARVLESDYPDNTPHSAVNVATFRGHIKPLTSASFSPDSKYLVTGSEDRTARVWDLTTLTVFTVGDVTVNSDRPSYSGQCPVTIKFTGKISASGRSGRVKYKFVRSDGTQSLPQEVVFDTPGEREVTDTKDVFAGYNRAGRVIPTSGSVRLEIIEPVSKTSDAAVYNVTCTDSAAQLSDAALTADQLKQIVPNASAQDIALYLPHIQQAMGEFGINTLQRRAAFLAAVAYGTVDLTSMEDPADDVTLKRKGLRKDLGNVELDDGIRFKGRGPFLMAGRANYKSLGEVLGVDLIKEPQRAASPELAFRIAALVWSRYGLNETADKENLESLNGIFEYSREDGVNLKDYYDRAVRVLSR